LLHIVLDSLQKPCLVNNMQNEKIDVTFKFV